MLLILICLLFSTQLIAQQYYTKKGKVSFFSEPPIENISAINEHAFLTQTNGQWLEGYIYFGFNISRVFSC
tara:strand:+ start:8377 stop:8589 length:213 start_codon:yes stop_codon:yes gene_type:complete